MTIQYEMDKDDTNDYAKPVTEKPMGIQLGV